MVTATTDVRTSACAGPTSGELSSFCRGVLVNRLFAPLVGQAGLRVGGLQGSDSVSTRHPPVQPLPDPIPLKIQFPFSNGRKLLLLRPQLVDEKNPTKFRPGANTIIAVDTMGAGIGELVMFCQGSSARLAGGMKDAPVDAVIIGIVDTVDVLGKEIYSARA